MCIRDRTTAGGNFIADLVTGSTGYATLNGLEPGSYVVKEVEAPDGHIIDSTPCLLYTSQLCRPVSVIGPVFPVTIRMP